jgi:hypothetical protein
MDLLIVMTLIAMKHDVMTMEIQVLVETKDFPRIMEAPMSAAAQQKSMIAAGMESQIRVEAANAAPILLIQK